MVEILIGMIASGKSTYAHQRAAQGTLIVNDDAIVMAVHANNYSLYDKSLKPLYKSIENHIITSGIMMGRDVAIDRPNFRKQTRARYISIAKSLDVKINAVVCKLEAAEVHAARRMRHDSRGMPYEMWLEVAERHLRLWQDPTLDEGFDDIRYL